MVVFILSHGQISVSSFTRLALGEGGILNVMGTLTLRFLPKVSTKSYFNGPRANK